MSFSLKKVETQIGLANYKIWGGSAKHRVAVNKTGQFSSLDIVVSLLEIPPEDFLKLALLICNRFPSQSTI